MLNRKERLTAFTVYEIHPRDYKHHTKEVPDAEGFTIEEAPDDRDDGDKICNCGGEDGRSGLNKPVEQDERHGCANHGQDGDIPERCQRLRVSGDGSYESRGDQNDESYRQDGHECERCKGYRMYPFEVLAQEV